MSEDFRIIPCTHCGSEGQLIYAAGIDFHNGGIIERYEPCPVCEGSGAEIIDVEPITIEDLSEMEIAP